MIKAFYKYIWEVSARQQLVLTGLAIGVFLLELVPLELQRRIVNGAVERQEFKYIGVLCLIYLGVAFLHGGLKLVLNVYRGSVSETTNKRLRMQVNASGDEDAKKKDAAPGEEGVKISIIVSEVEAVGTFVGSSFSEPVLNGGILLSVLGYMVYTQPWMALVAFLMFCPQFLFIPFLQEAINRRTKRRIETLRALSTDIVNEAAARTAAPRRTFRRRVGFVYFLNMQIFVRKYGINFLMNLLYTLSVIGILAVGCWLLLRGQTEVGTIVAFISGLSRMNDPWRDLVAYFRDMTNASTKYHLVAERLHAAPAAAD